MKKILSSLFCLLILFTSIDSHAKAYSKAFLADFDSVWKGVLISLTKYPLDKNNQEAGEIVTSVIKTGRAFAPYNAEINPREFYQLFISVHKRLYKGRKITQVKIEKKAFLKGDFIFKEKELVSDGVEESIVLYRTAREVQIDKTVDKLFN